MLENLEQIKINLSLANQLQKINEIFNETFAKRKLRMICIFFFAFCFSCILSSKLCSRARSYCNHNLRLGSM